MTTETFTTENICQIQKYLVQLVTVTGYCFNVEGLLTNIFWFALKLPINIQAVFLWKSCIALNIFLDK